MCFVVYFLEFFHFLTKQSRRLEKRDVDYHYKNKLIIRGGKRDEDI